MVLNIKKIIFTLFVLTTVFSTLTSYGEDDKYIKSMGYGGKGGNHFEWKSEYPDYKLKEIYYTAGGSLDSYQMVYYYKDKLMKSPIFGNPSHQQQSWKVPDGEYVIKIIIYSGNLIDSIQFKTNKGTYSPKFGGNGGIQHIIDIPEHYQIGGVYGRGGNSIDYIGFYLQKNNACSAIYHEKNYLCNGGFQQPKLPSGQDWQYYNNIPCWKGNHIIEIANGLHKGINFYTQVIELDANAGNKQYYQEFDLPYDGDYILRFEYGARAGVGLKESSFHVVYNDHIILTVQPDSRNVKEITIIVYGSKGKNKVQFWDNDYKKEGYGASIDNVGVYAKH